MVVSFTVGVSGDFVHAVHYVCRVGRGGRGERRGQRDVGAAVVLEFEVVERCVCREGGG